MGLAVDFLDLSPPKRVEAVTVAELGGQVNDTEATTQQNSDVEPQRRLRQHREGRRSSAFLKIVETYGCCVCTIQTQTNGIFELREGLLKLLSAKR
jgi:adenosyl cobinamide kinase/adenosyl cobinamide phosphate guanylyltransferase